MSFPRPKHIVFSRQNFLLPPATPPNSVTTFLPVHSFSLAQFAPQLFQMTHAKMFFLLLSMGFEVLPSHRLAWRRRLPILTPIALVFVPFLPCTQNNVPFVIIPHDFLHSGVDLVFKRPPLPSFRCFLTDGRGMLSHPSFFESPAFLFSPYPYTKDRGSSYHIQQSPSPTYRPEFSTAGYLILFPY